MTNKKNWISNQLELKRFPEFKREKLRAWDAADEYLLNSFPIFDHKNTPKEQDKVLIFNDAFGAICLNLLKANPNQKITFITDSINSKKGLINNANINDIDLKHINIINTLSHLSEVYNYVIIKSPKSIDMLVYMLNKIQPHITRKCQIFIAGMVKHLPQKIWKILEHNFGETLTSLTMKKAKIIQLSMTQNNVLDKFPITYKQNNFTIYNHASVFSKNSLDIGTRFLLDNFPPLPEIKNIIDLGCGNGIIGLNLAHKYPNAQITLTDESYMAIASSKLTIDNNLEDNKNICFKLNNCLDDFKSNSVDLIVCNPPFHQSQNIGIDIALNMFKQSHKTIKKGGYFVVIANRHLPYYIHLKRIFSTTKTLCSNQKFNLYLMSK
ncbi:MAG: methyltransferase [Marinicellaceae bacterium]